MNKRNINTTYRVATGFGLLSIYSFGIFLLLATILFSIDFVPELTINAESERSSPSVSISTSTKVGADTEDTYQNNESVLNSVKDEEDITNTVENKIETGFVTTSKIPTRIKIDSIGIDTPVLTPNNTDIAVLDKALLSGAVHYPSSGLLDENANMLLFGHSSYLPVIHNQAYKAFNELNKLENGDKITVYSSTHMYTYSVNKVWLTEAEEAQVHFDSNEPLLTLATCNTFGTKQERWIVTASLESKNRISH